MSNTGIKKNVPTLLKLRTERREEFIDITSIVGDIIKAARWQNGAVFIFCQHTTCGLTINESADPDVREDLMKFLDEIAPHSEKWAHREGNSDAHIRSSLLGVSLLVPLHDGHICLGRWQAIYFYEGDGPRNRNVWVEFLPG